MGNDLDRGISGVDVVVESLRRLCIWKEYGEEDGIGEPWWDYVNEFMFRCDTPEYFSIEQCMTDSGGLEGNVVNTLIDAELANKENRGVVILPQAYVNNAAIRGALEFSTILRAVCAGFVTGSEPDICRKCIPCNDQLTCTIEESCPSASYMENAVSTPTFALTLFTLSAFFLLFGTIQYKRTQSNIRNNVRGIVAEYMPLDEEKEVDTEIS